MINLMKGQKVNLSKENPKLKNVLVGLGWDTNKYTGNADFDLDASAFLTDANGIAHSDNDIIFYNNPTHPSGAVVYGGDNRTGNGDGDDEQIEVNLELVPAEIQKIAFTVTIYEAEARRQNFGQVSNAYIHMVNAETNEEISRFDLTEDYSIETAIVVAELYRYNGEWKFQAIGSGFQGGLAALCRNYGLEA
jgi:tellurium resistance protein TerD